MTAATGTPPGAVTAPRTAPATPRASGSTPLQPTGSAPLVPTGLSPTPPESTPARVHWLVLAATLAGAVAVASAALEAAHQPRPSLLLLLAVVAVVLVGDISLLRIRVGHNGNSFTWAEASIILGASMGGWAWLIALGTGTILARQLAVGRAPHKAAYNAASLAVGATLGRLAFWAVSGSWKGIGSHLSWLEAGGLFVGAGVYFLWVSAVIALAVAWAQDLPVRAVWSRGSQLRTVMFAGNTLFALATVAVGDWNRPTIVVLPFFLLVLYLGYNNFLRAQQERDTWRELHAATLSLKRVQSHAVLAAVQRGADTLFGSEVSAVVTEGDPRVAEVLIPALVRRGLAERGPSVVHASTASAEVQAEMAALGVESVSMAPLESIGQRLGVLLLGYRGTVAMKRRELLVLATFAEQTSISLQHARLFEELSGERERLSAIVQHASDGILLVDTTGAVCAWNPAMARITGRPESQVIGQPLRSALQAAYSDATDREGAVVDGAELVRRLRDTAELRLPVSVTTADGRNRDCVLAVSAVRDADPNRNFAVVVAHDVTAQRELDQAKQDFIATVSHELRTPLTPIKGYLTLLLRPDFTPDDAKRDSLLRILLDQSGQLERLVEDLLSVSRMQHGEFSVHVEECDVLEVVRRAARDIASATNRPLELDLPDAPLSASCDPARLQQVVSNLLTNADKYSPAGLSAHVRVAATTTGVEIIVRDEGSGVPLDQREAVFEPFRRLGDALTRGTRGTGLGLHIARRLVDSMGGRIWVEGEPGHGASFHVTLPAAVAAAADAVVGSAAAAAGAATAAAGGPQEPVTETDRPLADTVR